MVPPPTSTTTTLLTPDTAATVIARAWRRKQIEDRQKDFFLIDAGGQQIEASRKALVQQARLPALTSLAENPKIRRASLQDVSPQCARPLVGYLEKGTIETTPANLTNLAAVGKVHNLLALRQECQMLDRQHQTSQDPVLNTTPPASFTARWVIQPVVHFGRALTRTGLRMLGFQSKWHNTSVGRMHLLAGTGEGNLPTVVVLHGVTSCANDYAPLLTRLKAKCRQVIALDLPGHGLSKLSNDQLHGDTLLTGAIEALNGALEKVEGPVVIYANSMGGMAAVHFASRYPEKVQGLFLSSPGGAPVAEEDLDSFLGTFRAGSTKEGRTLIDRIFATQPPFRNLVGYGIGAYLASENVQALLDNVKSEDFLTKEMVQSLPQKNIFFSWGKQDQMLRYQDREWWKANLPRHAVISEPEEFGHFPIWDNPDLLAEHVCELAKVVADSTGGNITSPHSAEGTPV